MNYSAVIGLEIHVELKTETKMFCGCSAAFGEEPNSCCCPVCLGLPGSLPVINRKALELGVKAARALNCTVEANSRFDRKNYFYPDLPKAYQISQYDVPLGHSGYLEVEPLAGKQIGIQRCHLEEEAGKLLHQGGSLMEAEYSLVDYNRAGIPLLEIVTAPGLASGEEAYHFLNELRLLLLYNGISDCRMEEGSLRCDANISLSPFNSDTWGNKVEVKNLNSFKAVKAALEFEVARQEEVLSRRGEVVQETRHWDEDQRKTSSLRGKEEVANYRYFPEPDLPPLQLDGIWIQKVEDSLAETPAERRRRYREQHGLKEREAELLVAHPPLADFFDRAAVKYNGYRELFNWISGEIARIARQKNISPEVIDPGVLVETLLLMDEGSINRVTAKVVLEEALMGGIKPAELAKEKEAEQITDTVALGEMVEEVLRDNPRAMRDYLEGKGKAGNFLLGQVMGRTGGKADPSVVKEILEEQVYRRRGERDERD